MPSSGQPTLPVSPVVQVKAGVVPIAAFAPFFIAHDLGYFTELGLDVELVPNASIVELLPALAQGQLQVGGCTPNVACFNFMNRRTDVQIVADLQSAGRTERSRRSVGLVARKDLWDAGTIREPRDLVGRTVYVITGMGSAPHVHVARWLKQNGVDPREVEISSLPFPEVYAAMQNRGIEVGYQTEPLLSAGIQAGVHTLLAGLEDMDPAAQELYVMYWTGIDRLGPQVGERFMVAYLRAARAYLNAFEYGVDQEAIIGVLVNATPIKDPAVFRTIHYPWVDPNGQVTRTSLEADAELFRELGLVGPVDLSQAFEDKYRRFAVAYLGEYRPPQ
ncbi:MAG: ABC transporter substrate-binding protein [Chloroflexi bacterium]|nr:ABC transporter substrate-binding protein [Chloroflexota bacterium]